MKLFIHARVTLKYLNFCSTQIGCVKQHTMKPWVFCTGVLLL